MLRDHPRLIAGLLIGLAAARMVTTFRVFSATTDEGTHVSAGIELLQFHRYTIQNVNPPLPRIVLAAVPWLSGMRLPPSSNPYVQQIELLYGNHEYVRNLVRIRVGNLLFFAIACIALFAWVRREAVHSPAAQPALSAVEARRPLPGEEEVGPAEQDRVRGLTGGDAEALIALLLFTMEPIVLGYSALATHDVAGVAGVAVSLVAFSAWLRKPGVATAALLGVAYGFAVLCKFSCIGFVPAACAAFFAVHAIRERRVRGVATVLIVPLIAFGVVWAGYAFTVGTAAVVPPPLHKYFGQVGGWIFDHIPASTPLPAPSFWRGLADLIQLDHFGLRSYFFGRISDQGFFWYFPAAIALKTTLPFLAIVIAAIIVGGKRVVAPIAAAILMLLLCTGSRLDLGVRYALPVYVPLSMAAAIGAVAMLRSGGVRKRVAVALIALQVVVSAFAHPDYFPYFNVLAGRDPSRYLVDSNLDWGQDVLRLRHVVRALGIKKLGVRIPGLPYYDALHFPPTYAAMADAPLHGWIAIGDHMYRTDKGWSRLDGLTPRRVGKSIRLYFVK